MPHGIGETVMNPGGDDLHCLCGNATHLSGFDPCLSDGTLVEPIQGGPWDGKLYRCLACGRVIDIQESKVVDWYRLEKPK